MLGNKMAFGIRGEEVPVDSRRHGQKAIDGAARKLDFERVQFSAVTDAGDVARLHGYSLDAGPNVLFLPMEPISEAKQKSEE